MPTPSKKPLVIVTRKLPEAVETRMRELFDARLNVDDQPMSPAELVEAVKTAHVLVPTVTDRIDRSLLSQAGPQLKLIANFGNGVDNIDLDTARVRGIMVTNTPGVLTEDTADMTMALILAVPRRLAEGAALLKDPAQALARLVADLDAGPAHLGQAARHHRHGPHRPGGGAARQGVRPADPLPQPPPVSQDIEQELEATYWDSLDQMLARMDIVSVNCPHTPATYHLLSARRLKLLQADRLHRQHRARRGHRRERARRMIEAGEIAGAGLDVFEHEPAVNPKLAGERRAWWRCRTWARPRIEGRIDMGEKVIINIKTFVDGHNPPDRVTRRCSEGLYSIAGVSASGRNRCCGSVRNLRDFRRAG